MFPAITLTVKCKPLKCNVQNCDYRTNFLFCLLCFNVSFDDIEWKPYFTVKLSGYTSIVILDYSDKVVYPTLF